MPVRGTHKILGVKIASLSKTLSELRKSIKECERLSSQLSGEVDVLSGEESNDENEESTPTGETAMEILDGSVIPDFDDIEGAIGEIASLVSEMKRQLENDLWNELFSTMEVSKS